MHVYRQMTLLWAGVELNQNTSQQPQMRMDV